MRTFLFAPAFLGALLHCASVQAPNRYDACEKITVGAGTEDFALSPDGTTIYVSSHERRGWKVPGDIFALNLKSRQVKKLTRNGEPTDAFFAPHGIDLLVKGNEKYLYVVNHGKEMNDADQSILIYRISGDSLSFVMRVRHELINSPNDVSAVENGGFYVTNDHGSRGSLWEVFWGLKRSKVTFCTLSNLVSGAEVDCRVAIEGLAMANGILAEKDKVYISATRENAVYEFTRNADGTLANMTKVADTSGPDNLFRYDKFLLTASHTSNWKFFRHASSAANKAPSYIVSIDLQNKEVGGLYYSDGTEISAASGAFVHSGRLYISQVFEDFILECRPVQ